MVGLFAVPLLAFAEDGESNSSKQGTIIQYGENGGLLFSFPMTLESRLNWSRLPGEYTNFKRSEAILHAPIGAEYGISSCGTYFSLRPSTNIGSSTVSLPYMGSYIIPPNTYAFYAGRISTDKPYPWSTIATRYSPFTATITNYAAATPEPSLCTGGGGSITDSFTVSH